MNIEIIKKVLCLENSSDSKNIVNNIIIYLRKSRKDSDYYKDEPIEKTLERHEKGLQEWAINIFGIKIPQENIFREVASGDTIDDRPIMQEVLKKIEDNNIKAVLCIEIERLARGNTIDQGIIANAFKYSNTKIITPYKIYDLDNEDDLVYFEDGLYQSRKYLLYTKRILKRGRIRSVQDGKYIGSYEPYGYTKKKLINEKGYTLIINLEEKKIVNLIADLYAYGINTTYQIKKDDTILSIAKIYGMTKKELSFCNPISNFKENDIIRIKYEMGLSTIANYLNYLNIKPRKSSSWTPSSIKNLLTSPTLYGYVSWGARQTVTIMKDGTFIKTRPRNKNCIYVKGKFTPILDLDDTRTKIIINKLKTNRISKVPSCYEIKNPLSGLIICPFCQKKIVRRPYTKKYHIDTLYCKTTHCKTVGSSLYLVENIILSALKISLKEYTNFINNYNSLYKKDNKNPNNLTTILDDRIKKTNSKIQKCYDFLEDGTYTKDIFKERINKLKLELLNLEKNKTEVLNIDTNYKHKDINKRIPILGIALESYNECNTIDKKNKLLYSIIDKVIYEKTKGGRGYEDKFNLKIFLKI